jgi:hypothetical protein
MRSNYTSPFPYGNEADLHKFWKLAHRFTIDGIGCKAFCSEPVFLNVYGAQESIPRYEFRQPM